MTQVTWLHLSDWHQRGEDFNRKVVRDALLKDIRERAKAIDSHLSKIDFIVFSGDLAFSGKDSEYRAAREFLLDPVLDATGLDTNRLFMVPGNHDIDRESFELLPSGLQKPFESEEEVQNWLENKKKKRTRVLEPFEVYEDFVTQYTGQPSPTFASIQRMEVGEKRITLLGLNSALMCTRHRTKDGKVDDYGYLSIGEPQVYEALQQIADDDIKIAVLHHPFAWLAEFDQSRVEARLRQECHFILYGHQHLPQVRVEQGTEGSCIVIPAGASYDRRQPSDSRYTNAYNFVHCDFVTGRGKVFLRRWGDRRSTWLSDTETTSDGSVSFSLPKDLNLPPPPTSSTLVPPQRFASPSLDSSVNQQDLQVIEGYLKALLRDNAELEPGGIKQTKVQVILPLDEIYVSLQADRDKPDVDRRVMQEELDDIKKRLHHEDDPLLREQQYQIWANQARHLERALELTGPREELSHIIQNNRKVVILGDPGAGKTTLLRYLTLQFAKAIAEQPAKILQNYTWWDYQNIWKISDLGAVRLPILVRISHYAEARQGYPDLSLIDYLPRYFAGLQVPNADRLSTIFKQLLNRGRCLVLLDGLDEIIDPADRRNIATAIGQFTSVFQESGLPAWLTRSPSSYSTWQEEIEESIEIIEEQERLNSVFTMNLPRELIQELQKELASMPENRRREVEQELIQLFQQSGPTKGELIRLERAHKIATKLLRESKYAHVGNRFVVTSRIAGYHFAGVPGDFEHFTIRRMSREHIKVFLEKWCPAVERRMAENADDEQVEKRARREIEGILSSVEQNSGVRRMAENPLLLRILAIVHRNESHLPQRRVELYETATTTLLRDQ